MAVVGIIGGSGLDDPEILKSPRDIDIETAFGKTVVALVGNLTDVSKLCDGNLRLQTNDLSWH